MSNPLNLKTLRELLGPDLQISFVVKDLDAALDFWTRQMGVGPFVVFEKSLGDRRFVLYGGRREGAKNWDALIDAFGAAVRKEDLDLTLVTFGVGDVVVAPDVASRVIDLGLISDAERDDAFAAASAYSMAEGWT